MIIEEAQKILDRISYQDWQFRVHRLLGDDGFPDCMYLQLRFHAPDLAAGDEREWSSRKWLISPHATASEIVQTALKAVLTAVEHEAREAFLYRGKPIFGPHYNVDFLHAYCAMPYTQDPRPARAARMVGSEE